MFGFTFWLILILKTYELQLILGCLVVLAYNDFVFRVNQLEAMIYNFFPPNLIFTLKFYCTIHFHVKVFKP